MCNVLYIVCFFRLAIVLSVRLRFTDSDYPFRNLQILTFDLYNIVFFSHYSLFLKRDIEYGYQYSNLPLVVGLQ
jgi:hypothetical protein